MKTMICHSPKTFFFVVIHMWEEKEKDVEYEFTDVPDVIASQGSSNTSDPKKTNFKTGRDKKNKGSADEPGAGQMTDTWSMVTM